MKLEKEQIAKYQAAKKELETLILKKLDAVKEKVLTHNYETLGENIQVLVMVSDELDDVLMNWEVSMLSASTITDEDDLDEDD